jgi:hypothetical protein
MFLEMFYETYHEFMISSAYLQLDCITEKCLMTVVRTYCPPIIYKLNRQKLISIQLGLKLLLMFSLKRVCWDIILPGFSHERFQSIPWG